jgi:excinuclease ABC subunit A
VDTGNTVILIEHNLDVIKNSDWVIDLGPGAGDKGGKLIATGTPEQLAANAKSFTGKYLKRLLKPTGRDTKPAKSKTTVRKTAKTPAKAKEPAVAAVGD